MPRQRSDRAGGEAQRRLAARERRAREAPAFTPSPMLDTTPDELQDALWVGSRSGARAGRGFRFQDLVTTLLVLELWRDGAAHAIVVPEGFDDVSIDIHSGGRYIQVKSRRESVGDFKMSDLRLHLRSVAEDWLRRREAGLSLHTTLLLERPIVGVAAPDWAGALEGTGGDTLTESEIGDAMRGFSFPDAQVASEFANSVAIAICGDPRTKAIAAVTATRDVPESVAEIIVAEMCARVGAASDANADRGAPDPAGIPVATVDTIVDQILGSIDLGLLDEARVLGICQSIDWELFPGDATLAHGAHVGPNHVVSELLVPRPALVEQVSELIEKRKLAVIAGPSGSGKSALAHMVAYGSRNAYRWQQVLSMAPSDRTGRDAVALLVSRVEALRPSVYAPVGVLIDDAGRHDPGLVDRILRRLADLPNVAVIVSVREEDRFPVPILASVATISPVLDNDFAEELWRRYSADGLTSWAGWREPYETSNNLLLEYVTLLTEGDTLESTVRAQVNARELDRTRHVELEIIRIVSCANQYGVRVPVDSVRSGIGANLLEFTTAYRRLVDEHLLFEIGDGLLSPLHEIRSAALARASHPFGQSQTLRDLVALVPVNELARFLRRAIESGADLQAMLEAAAERVTQTRTIEVLVAVVSAFRTDGLRRRADEWKRILDECGVEATHAVTAFMMSRTQPRADVDELFRPEIVAAIQRLRQIPTEPDMQPVWRALDGPFIDSLLASYLADDGPAPLLVQALTSLRGIDASALGRIADVIGSHLMNWPLDDAADVVEALRRVAPELAARATLTAGGEQQLLDRAAAETPWLASLVREDDGVLGRWVFVDEEVQGAGHQSVVDVCRTALALAPTAEIARVSAVTPTGRLAMITTEYPLAEKAIPRENLPNALEVAENRAQARALSRKYGAGALTAKLAAESEALNALFELLPEILTAHLTERRVTQATIRLFGRATELLAQLDAPAEEGYADEMPGALGDYPGEDAAAAVVRGLLQQVVPNLAGAEIADRDPTRAVVILDNLIAKAAALIDVDRYRYLPEPPNPTGLLALLEQLRVVASVSIRNDWSIRSAMRTAAGRRTGVDRVAAAAEAAVERATSRLGREAANTERALRGMGFTVSAVASTSDSSMLNWPPGDLAITVEGTTLIAHVTSVGELAEAVRAVREIPDRRVWIGLRTDAGYLRSSIFEVVDSGVLPLAGRTTPAAFSDTLAPAPMSKLYESYVQSARRISAVAAIIAIRGVTTIPDEEGRVLEQAWELLEQTSATIDEMTAGHGPSDYATGLYELLAKIRATLVDDLSTAVAQGEGEQAGWEAIGSLTNLEMFDPDQADAPDSDAAIVYGTALVIAEIEDDFANADRRLAALQPQNGGIDGSDL